MNWIYCREIDHGKSWTWAIEFWEEMLEMSVWS
jgi:hypothetical protein